LEPNKILKDALKNVGEKLLATPDGNINPVDMREKLTISDRVISNIHTRLLMDKRIRRKLPVWGYLNIDRQLPFLIIYRKPVNQNDPGTSRMIVSEAAYLTASGDKQLQSSLSKLVKNITSTLSEMFGAFLIIEIWAGPEETIEGEAEDYKPHFRIYTKRSDVVSSTVDVLQNALKQITTKRQSAEVEVIKMSKIHPPDLPPLISNKEANDLNIHRLGIEIRPIYRDLFSGKEFPVIRRVLHHGFVSALKQGIFEFTQNQTTHQPKNYQALGSRSFVKLVWEVDKQLADVSNQFDFLLTASPLNPDTAWTFFKRKRFRIIPKFFYRPLPIEPILIKRQLFHIPIERVEDPALAQLFRSQQIEMDRKLSMLSERGTERFKYGSLQLYGGVDDQLRAAAEAILFQFPPRTRDESKGGVVDATTFAKRVEQRIEYYRQIYPRVFSKAKVCDDVAGLMVTRGHLLINKTIKIPSSRVEALIAHEVDTHIVTYYNGLAQPFRQLYVGLPNYDELQEGLAVLAEYLVGGLNRPRLRLLAARVVAAKSMIDGASFIDVFRKLNDTYSFEQKTAFTITMRIFRSGGLSKDAVYLRGLLNLLEYLKEGGELEPLYIGKFGMEHLPLIKELQARKILTPPPLRPHFLDDPKSQERIKLLLSGNMTVLDLVGKH